MVPTLFAHPVFKLCYPYTTQVILSKVEAPPFGDLLPFDFIHMNTPVHIILSYENLIKFPLIRFGTNFA